MASGYQNGMKNKVRVVLDKPSDKVANRRYHDDEIVDFNGKTVQPDYAPKREPKQKLKLPVEPVGLERILAYLPIPFIGERAARKVVLNDVNRDVNEGRIKGTEQQIESYKNRLFYAHRFFAYTVFGAGPVLAALAFIKYMK